MFRQASRLRGAAAFHPRGVVFRGTWLPEPETDALAGSPLVARPTDAILRLSHGIGLPPSWPDILGLAIKIVDVHGPGRDQDLLLASAGSRGWRRHLLRPARDYARVSLSSILPYQFAGIRVPVVAHVGPTANTAAYADIVRSGPNAVPLINVYLGSRWGPRLARVVTTDHVAPEVARDVRFDPFNTGPELHPVGRLNELRRPTYAASQEGRGLGPPRLLARLRGDVVARVRSRGGDTRAAG